MIALLLTLSNASAGSLAGVTLPETAKAGDSALVLNGMGLREKYMLDVYVAGLYLASKSRDAQSIIDADEAKQLVMVMKMDLGQQKLSESITEAITGKGLSAEAVKGIHQIAGWMQDVSEGDKVMLEYVPGLGTSLYVRGSKRGTVEGLAVAQGLFAIFLGDPPVTKDLKNGLLGR
mgnify:CR=1 FL=1